MITRRAATAVLVGTPLLAAVPARAQTSSLPSWSDGPSKQAIVEFVARVTREGGPDHVPPGERIAVFDNDGTLWAEQPMYFQAVFAYDSLKAMALQHPEWRTQQPFKAFLEGDQQGLVAQGHKAILSLVTTAHSNMTTEDFIKRVRDWLASARHPRFNRPYNELVYQPMVELLDFLRASGFKTFIVSGGGVEFIRVWGETAYGIPPEQVVGSSGVVRFNRAADGTITLNKEPQVEFIDDHEGKPVGINRFIGRRPIFAFGNSDGDHEMLQYTAAGGGARFMGLIHHTDPEREWAYDRASHVGKLDKALDEAAQRGWTIVHMKRDWKRVFPFTS